MREVYANNERRVKGKSAIAESSDPERKKKGEINEAKISKEFRVLRAFLRCSSRKGEVSSYLMPESHLLRTSFPYVLDS